MALLLLVALCMSAQAPQPKTYDDRVASSWNSFQEESKSWTAMVNNQLTWKKRSKMEKDRFERMKEKWALVVVEVESLP